jgi:hypothetical protein
LNSTTAGRNFLVGYTPRSFLKLVRPIAGKNGMRVGINKPGQDDSSVCIEYCATVINQRLNLAAFANVRNTSISD